MNISDTYCAAPLAAIGSLPLGVLPQAETRDTLDADKLSEVAWEWDDDPFQTCDFGEGRTLPECK